MNWVDIAIVALVAFSALIGLARGLIREILSLAIWACALLLAWIYYPKAAVYLEPWTAPGSFRIAAAFLSVVLVVLVLGALVGHLVTLLVEKTGLTGTDRLLGALFGAGRGALLVAMAVFLAALTPLPADAWWQESALIGRFQSLAERVLGEVPPELVERIKKL